MNYTDHAAALARAILDIVSPCLREEEKCEAYQMFVAASAAALASYRQSLLTPSEN